MYSTENIEYNLAQDLFQQAEKEGTKLTPGNIDTTLWLHRENINHDFVIQTARNYSDSRIFIISKGTYKGFYIYSKLKLNCVKIIQLSPKESTLQTV